MLAEKARPAHIFKGKAKQGKASQLPRPGPLQKRQVEALDPWRPSDPQDTFPKALTREIKWMQLITGS